MGETQENNIQQTSEQDLWQEEAAMMHIFSRNRKNNLRTLLSLFKGHYGALVGSIFFFIIKHSPTWVLPIVTANIINAVTDHNGNITKILILNTILMIAFLVQNIPTNYIHTWLYAKTVRTVEKELREALVCKLQQLSITYHKEMQSGRLQSKIMRDVEQIQNLASQIFISLLTIILNIGVSFGVVIFKSRIVFLFFLCTIPVSVLIIVGFKGKIKNHNRAFRKEMEETSAKVMEMVEMIPVTKAHALEDQEARKMSEQLRKVAEKGLQLDMIQTYFSSISWVAFQIFQVFCLAFTAYIAWKGIIGVGDITLYQTYFSSIVAQIASIVTLLPIIAKGLESVESIGDVLCANDIEDNCRLFVLLENERDSLYPYNPPRTVCVLPKPLSIASRIPGLPFLTPYLPFPILSSEQNIHSPRLHSEAPQIPLLLFQILRSFSYPPFPINKYYILKAVLSIQKSFSTTKKYFVPD